MGFLGPPRDYKTIIICDSKCKFFWLKYMLINLIIKKYIFKVNFKESLITRFNSSVKDLL